MLPPGIASRTPAMDACWQSPLIGSGERSSPDQGLSMRFSFSVAWHSSPSFSCLPRFSTAAASATALLALLGASGCSSDAPNGGSTVVDALQPQGGSGSSG